MKLKDGRIQKSRIGMLLLGLKFKKLIIPAAAGMALFMTAAVYFHFSISDPIIPTAPSLAMLMSCISIIYIEKKYS